VTSTTLIKPRSSADCVERMLAASVLFQAADDLQTFRCECRQSVQLLYREVRDWVTSDDRSRPYSFLNLCDALHLTPAAVRAELLSGETNVPGDINQ